MTFRCPSCGYESPADGETHCPRCGQPRTTAATLHDVEPTDVPPTLGAVPGADTAGDGVPTLREGVQPQSVPGYEILEELGRGGMGVVYKARQLHPRRLVALKVILAGEYAGADSLARFRAEAEAVARLHHPAIIQIHQVGEWQPAAGPTLPYLTLEYVAGVTLARRLASSPPLGPREAADLVRQVALGVHYAHTRGILHRDLKPGNILLAEPPGEPTATTPTPKIVDFGLAKTLEGAASVAQAGPRTQTGVILGTPNYMAPEQADGKGRPVGPPADVYALGAVLYECLAGRPPFEGDTTLDTLIRVVHEEPPSLRRVPRALNTICLRCLEKDPARRYATAADLAEDLRRFLDGEWVRSPSVVDRFARWARRRREFVYLMGGAAAAGVVVLAVAMLRGSVTPEQPRPPATTAPVAVVSKAAEGDDTAFAEVRARLASANNLKHLGVALHNYHAAMGEFPPPAVCDKKDGKPLLSWRVLVLPYLEEETAFQKFNLDEPWDSEHNRKLLSPMPKAFAAAGRGIVDPTATHYQAVVGPGAAWERIPNPKAELGARGLKFTDFTDGTSNTVLLVEAADAVPWTKPDDVAFDPIRLPRLGGQYQDAFNVLWADGSVRALSADANAATLRAAFSRNGGELPAPAR
jgi:prepilin-type processing-associated H-X9-DG protein